MGIITCVVDMMRGRSQIICCGSSIIQEPLVCIVGPGTPSSPHISISRHLSASGTRVRLIFDWAPKLQKRADHKLYTPSPHA